MQRARQDQRADRRHRQGESKEQLAGGLEADDGAERADDQVERQIGVEAALQGIEFCQRIRTRQRAADIQPREMIWIVREDGVGDLKDRPDDQRQGDRVAERGERGVSPRLDAARRR